MNPFSYMKCTYVFCYCVCTVLVYEKSKSLAPCFSAEWSYSYSVKSTHHWCFCLHFLLSTTGLDYVYSQETTFCFRLPSTGSCRSFNSLTFNSTPTAENIDCNNFVITVTCCRATLVVSWPEAALPHNISSCLSRCLVEHRTSNNFSTTTSVVAWRLVVAWPFPKQNKSFTFFPDPTSIPQAIWTKALLDSLAWPPLLLDYYTTSLVFHSVLNQNRTTRIHLLLLILNWTP